ncbi:hypothetical protein K7X08_031921 [Anisodus acutangulus]|uniref:Methyltransferase type 11 domain-containing protein n=1 Tax=Anisodus acutangulus TaxID=402998 RepID=A0A9Q1MN38_9SOLA|nr:hypothetical protein K7X08_031921 [Anisodus acutangulus]
MARSFCFKEIGYIFSRSFSTMKEVVIDSASSLHTSESVGETPVLRPVSLRAKCSSNVQPAPDIEKNDFYCCVASPSTENRRRKAVEELVRVVKKGGSVLITVWAREQEDRSLIEKWTPLNQRYVEEWIGPGSPRVRNPSSPRFLESIPEAEENGARERLKDRHANSSKVNLAEVMNSISLDEGNSSPTGSEKGYAEQQEYFVPWHLPYHRAEYHVFSEGELERLVSGLHNAILVDRFYDKSNWCIILEKTS